MSAQEYLNSNHYETEMHKDEAMVDPHESVGGLPDDRMNDESDFKVNPELSCTNL
jgi:hypothetical protein